LRYIDWGDWKNNIFHVTAEYSVERTRSDETARPDIVLFVNGHQALECGLRALRLEGEVITTPFTFASTIHAIVRCGLTPVFCDIRMSDYNIDAEEVETLVTERTCAILPVHVYGTPCDVGRIGEIGSRLGLRVIYDAAHAFGVELAGEGVGTFGEFSMLSFHATKVFNTIEGGALTLTDADLASELRLMRNFGIAGPEDVPVTGTNAKMNELQALMGLVNLKYVDNELDARKAKVDLYRQLLAGIPGIRVMADPPHVRANYSYMPVLIDESQYGKTRDGLFQELARHRIYARKYFYPLASDYECYRGLPRAELRVARYVADRIMTLPLWGAMPDEVIAETCRVIRETSPST